ncbi:MAG: hypothetical protein ACPGUI_00435 [Halarcobacter sp.]
MSLSIIEMMNLKTLSSTKKEIKTSLNIDDFNSFENEVLIQKEFFSYDKLVQWLEKKPHIKSFTMVTPTTNYSFEVISNGVIINVFDSFMILSEKLFASFSVFLPQKKHYPMPDFLFRRKK